MNEHSLSFLFYPAFPAAACVFFFRFFLRNSFLTSVYLPFLHRAHFFFCRPLWPKSPHHSAAHKGGLRVPVSSTYDPNPAPYFFERLEKHAVTAVHVIACAQGASRLSVCRDRHVGHSWMTRRSELGVQSMNKVSGLTNVFVNYCLREKLFLEYLSNEISENEMFLWTSCSNLELSQLNIRAIYVMYEVYVKKMMRMIRMRMKKMRMNS